MDNAKTPRPERRQKTANCSESENSRYLKIQKLLTIQIFYDKLNTIHPHNNETFLEQPNLKCLIIYKSSTLRKDREILHP